MAEQTVDQQQEKAREKAEDDRYQRAEQQQAAYDDEYESRRETLSALALFQQDSVEQLAGGSRQNRRDYYQKLLSRLYIELRDLGASMLLDQLDAQLTQKHQGKCAMLVYSTVIVARDADLTLAARRIAFGKLLNAGQTCVAPDYVLVAREVEDAFVAALQKQFDQLCPDPLHSAEYVHIVNQKHFDRLTGLMASGQIVYGGSIDPAALRIAPTILRNVSPDSPVMQEEIFGPILPILPVSTIDEAIAFAAARPHPLACYLFTKGRAVQRRVLDTLPFGGGCINDTIIHLATSRMPFGGVGHSGMGGYHGRDSFRCFTHDKSIVKKALWLDLPMRYTPYSKKKETLIRFFLK